MSNERSIAENTKRAHFVPEEGISADALQANLKAYFGANAKIERRLRLDGEVGWLVAGGRVSPAIIETLREETQKLDKDAGRKQRAAVPSVPSSRHDTNTTMDPGRIPNNAGRSIPSPISRHTIDQAREQSRKPSDFDRLQRPPDRHSETTASPSRPYLPSRMSSGMHTRNFVRGEDDEDPDATPDYGFSPPTNNPERTRHQDRATSGPDSKPSSRRSGNKSSFPPPDPMEPYSPANQGRYPPTDVVDISPRETRHAGAATSIGRNSQSSLTTRHDKSSTSNTDPDYAALHPEIIFTQEDFHDYNNFKRYLGLKKLQEKHPLSQTTSKSLERSGRHQDEGSYTGDPPPAYQPEDAASTPRHLDSLRSSRGRDDDEDEDPDYGQQSIPQSNRHARERGADIGMHTRNFVRDEDDEDPDATPDYGLTTATTNPDRARHHQDSSTSDRHSKPSSRRSGNKDKDKGRGSRR